MNSYIQRKEQLSLPKHTQQAQSVNIHSNFNDHAERTNRIIDYTTISEGGLTATLVDLRIVMQTALVSNATSLILSHNHPSGMLKPSVQDDELTRKIKEACRIMEIRLLDHIIVTPENGYYSYADEGRL